jgi:hypothetical protein
MRISVLCFLLVLCSTRATPLMQQRLLVLLAVLFLVVLRVDFHGSRRR